MDEVKFFRSVWGLGVHVRSVWKAHGAREREWYIHEMRRLFVLHSRALKNPDLPLLQTNLEGVSAYDLLDVEQPSQGEPPPTDNNAIARDIQTRIDLKDSAWPWVYVIEPLPPLTVFERVMVHFQRIADRARQCGNEECPAPFFFVKKKGQEYCSPECALPAQQKSKREWWIRNRKQQAKKRRAERVGNGLSNQARKRKKQGSNT